MTYGALTPGDLAPFDVGRPRSLSQPLLCAAALALTSSVGLWMFYGRTAVQTPDAAQVTPVEIVAAPTPRPVDVAPAVVPLRRYAAMLDPAFVGGAQPMTFAQSAPLRSGFAPLRRSDVADATPLAAPRIAMPTSELAAPPQPAPQPNVTMASIDPATTDLDDTPDAANVPLPTPRPASLLPNHAESPRALARRLAEQPAEPPPVAPAPPAAAPAAPGQPSFFQKLFGGIAPRNALAYAAPEDGGLLGRPGAVDQVTAIYDIAAHTVYLPDGTRLEAHSGLGANLDDPRSVAMRMRGATPPATYELTEREALFHGVRALRLTPIGGGTTFGRGGLLAHTFMLGPRGDSNGCVVFRNYKAFLAAYDRGTIRRLVVVGSLR